MADVVLCVCYAKSGVASMVLCNMPVVRLVPSGCIEPGTDWLSRARCRDQEAKDHGMPVRFPTDADCKEAKTTQRRRELVLPLMLPLLLLRLLLSADAIPYAVSGTDATSCLR
eukprot:1752966-Rhodomonas_salina.2